MHKRRFSITQSEGELVITALESIVTMLEAEFTQLTPREINQLSQCKTLLNKLSSYQWEI